MNLVLACVLCSHATTWTMCFTGRGQINQDLIKSGQTKEKDKQEPVYVSVCDRCMVKVSGIFSVLCNTLVGQREKERKNGLHPYSVH